MRVAGVSLEDDSLKFTIVDKKIGIIKSIASEDVNLPASEQERSTILQETFLKLNEKYKIESIVIGLSFNDFLHNIIDMPLLSEADTKNALFYELEKYLPLPPEEYIYDLVLIEKIKKTTRNLAFSIRKEKMDRLLNIIKGFGLKLAAVRCSFIEAINEFITSGKIKDAVFVYAAKDVYNVVGIRGQKPVLFRSISKGENAVSEFEKFSESFTGSVYISGIPEPDISNKLNAKTFSLSLSHAVALSVLRKPNIKLNFMPAEFLPKKKDYSPYILGAMAVIAVLLFFLTEIYPYYKDYTALSNVEKKLGQIKGKASGFLEARKNMESIYEKRKFLYEFQGEKNFNIRVLTELSRLLPKDTWLISMSVDEKGKVEIEGLSKHAIGIIDPFSKSKLFTKVKFISPIVLQDSEEKFSISMSARPDSGEIAE